MNKTELSTKTLPELKKVAGDLKITGISKKTKADIVDLILQKSKQDNPKPTKPAKNDAKANKGVKEEKKEEPKPVLPVQVEVEAKEVKQAQQPTVTQTAAQSPQRENQQFSRPQSNNHQRHQQNRNQFSQNNRNGQRNNHQNQNRPQNSNQYPDQVLEQNEPKITDESTVEVSGILEIMSDGTHGVLRSPRLIQSDKDTYISISQVKKFRLRKGDFVKGIARLPKENERYFSLLWIKDVNGLAVDKMANRPNFDELKPVYPDKQIKLEVGQHPISNRVLDLLAPVGFGQRGMIVAQPKSGKTFLLKDIARGINENHPDVQLMVVLIGERPEEVTDIERSVNGIVYASNFDEDPKHQVAVAELSLERAKRLVEQGQDVIILMDSLTRLARAYNVALPASGRTLSGGLDPVSLYPSKKFFGAARNFENGASLTIIATALVDTGSKMDEVIFEEFKGTGNMEVHLDRKMSNRRIFPAIDLLKSSTRNEEILLGTDKLQLSWKIRRMLENLGQDAGEALIDRMKATKTNEEFADTLHQY
jgi:transcription termination factor Rho